VEQTLKPAALWVTFYGINANADLLARDFDDLTIREIRWEQKTRNSYQLKIKLSQSQLWGYNPYYENGNFYIDIKKQPTIEGGESTPFKGLIICLDPGHSPETGAIGPKGHVEKDLNYSYCVALAKELERKGAVVILTRGEKDGATLAARTQTALFMEADIFLSLHFNALPDGADPFKNRGVGTYYYHPHAHRFAQLIQKKLVKYTRLQNFGLFNDNLAMCRPTQMIAVLAEPGFLIHPWEEILIVSEFYRGKVVKAIVDALEEFLRENK
jgi:N-acetylmuramoyl-L-alanine amidase